MPSSERTSPGNWSRGRVVDAWLICTSRPNASRAIETQNTAQAGPRVAGPPPRSARPSKGMAWFAREVLVEAAMD